MRTKIDLVIVGIGLAVVFLIDMTVLPHHNLLILYSVPLLYTAWRSMPHYVVGTAIAAILFEVFGMVSEQTAGPIWPLTFPAFIIVCIFAVLLSAQRQATIRRAHEAEEAQKLLRNMYERITEGVIGVNRDWRIEYVNREALEFFQRTLNRSPNEVVGKNMWDVLPDAVGTRFDTEEHRAMTEQVPVAFEEYYAPARIWVETRAYPSPDGLSLFFRDVTERKRTEEEHARLLHDLQEAEERYRRLFEGVADAILVANDRGQYIDVNLAASELLGYSRDELLQMGIPQVVAQQNGWFEKEWERMRSDNAWRGELDLCRKNGTQVPVEARAMSIRLPAGVAHVSIIRDFSERKRIEYEREQLLTQEKQARAEADATREQLQRFLAMVVHDLRSPLTTLQGYTQLLERRIATDQSSDYQKLTDKIADATRRLRRLIQDLEDAARLGTGRFELHRGPMDLVAVVREVVEQQQEETTSHQLTIDAPDQIDGDWDRERIDQVVTNLISNAIKYSRDGSVAISIGTRDDSAYFCVADQGRGIAPDQLSLLFQPFSRIGENSTIKGTGLGLYIAKGIIAAHHGRIWAESTVGVGSTFCFTLPLID